MSTATSFYSRRQRSTRTTKQLFLELQRLQQEVQTLKRQITQMNETLQASEASKVSARYIPQSLSELSPRTLPPPGKTAMQMIQGQWPGEESTEELLAQLKALD